MAKLTGYTGYKCFYCGKYIYEFMGLVTWNGNICCYNCGDIQSEKEEKRCTLKSIKNLTGIASDTP